jgi:hypothetical protein
MGPGITGIVGRNSGPRSKGRLATGKESRLAWAEVGAVLEVSPRAAQKNQPAGCERHRPLKLGVRSQARRHRDSCAALLIVNFTAYKL